MVEGGRHARTLLHEVRPVAAVEEVSELDARLLRDIGLRWEDVDRGLMGKQRSIWLNPLSDDDK